MDAEIDIIRLKIFGLSSEVVLIGSASSRESLRPGFQSGQVGLFCTYQPIIYRVIDFSGPSIETTKINAYRMWLNT